MDLTNRLVSIIGSCAMENLVRIDPLPEVEHYLAKGAAGSPMVGSASTGAPSSQPKQDDLRPVRPDNSTEPGVS